jgi:murein DD-endopeptidase MepM/ murein hydrolase activator NlpD
LAKLLAFLLGFAAGAAALWTWGRGSVRPEGPAPVVRNEPARVASAAAITPTTTTLSLAPSSTPPPPELPPLASPSAPASAASSVPAPSRAEPPVLTTDLDRLRTRGLLPPIAGLNVRAIKDSFEEIHSGHRHEAIDILAPRATPVLAVDDGPVGKLFTSKPGGLTVYQFDPKGEYCYYYAHLDRYAEGLKEGVLLKRGDVLGYVGTTGNAPPGTPHLHFTIFRLGPEKRWWEGVPVNPYPLWAPAVP